MMPEEVAGSKPAGPTIQPIQMKNVPDAQLRSLRITAVDANFRRHHHADETGNTNDMHLETIWHVDTRQQHSLRIIHGDVPVENGADAYEKMSLIGKIVLHADGILLHHAPNKITTEIDPKDVIIEVYTRPFEDRGEAFIPDMSTAEGRARMEAAMTDPRYHATNADYAVVDMTLADLAAIPGASGHLESVAYNSRSDDRRRHAIV